MRALLLALACSSCMASSLATLGADTYQTTLISAEQWPNGRSESNVVLGEHPKPEAVLAYMGLCTLLVLLIDDELPEKYRPVFHSVLTTVEALTVYRNYQCDRGHCTTK